MKYKVTYTKTIEVNSDKKLSMHEVEEQARTKMYSFDFTERHMDYLTPQITARLGDYKSEDLKNSASWHWSDKADKGTINLKT